MGGNLAFKKCNEHVNPNKPFHKQPRTYVLTICLERNTNHLHDLGASLLQVGPLWQKHMSTQLATKEEWNN